MAKEKLILGFLIFLLTINYIQSNRCLTTIKEVNPKRYVLLDDQHLNIQFKLSKMVTHRLVTRIMEIFLEEVLGYANVSSVEKEDELNMMLTSARISDDSKDLKNSRIPETMINMEVWVPPQLDVTSELIKLDVKQTRTLTSPGYFGWFIPERLSRINDSWLIFTKRETAAHFKLDDENFTKIKSAMLKPDKRYYCQEDFCQDGMYVPPQCQSQGRFNREPCALLLTDYTDSTKFIIEHIEHWKLYVKVVWVGPNLKRIVKSLTEEYLQLMLNSTSIRKSLVILHRMPSHVVPNLREFVSVDFPKCGSRGDDHGCIYEARRLVKFVWRELEFRGKLAYEAISHVKFTSDMYENLINRYNGKWFNDFNSLHKSSVIEEEVACDWLKENLNYTLVNWMPEDEGKNTLRVAGIFPMTGSFYTAKSIVVAAQMAKTAINLNKTILRDYELKMLISDGQCKSEYVLKSFIDYILHPHFSQIIGVLGPACTETIEPLAGVSKHYHTMIMSYSAEGSGLSDRNRYPYFFRTIGENRQFKYVYLELLKKFNWHRIAAISEDGLKYTEYISHMQDLLRENDITFVANIKFPREWQLEIITNYLDDLKQKRARIIISDVYEPVARLIMCEAYKLKMTSVQGYVWFLPPWLRNDWYDTDSYNNKTEENTPCSTAEMKEAINGYLSISHATYASNDSYMQEGITVQEWRNNYEISCNKMKESMSPYAGYAYDAMWTYALAANRLLNENPSYIFDLHSEQTVKRLTQIISETDFNGVSGRIKFMNGSLLYSVIDIHQHQDGILQKIGSFYPNISENTSRIKGTLVLNTTNIVWLTPVIPDDGSFSPQDCSFPLIAALFDLSCESTNVVFTTIIFIFFFILIGIGFLTWKRRYDKKLQEQEILMKSLGLDSINRLDTLSLDKWEIPRQNVIINRKIGEGAFGTVYGGEAFFDGNGWLGVAVKTLKVGSSTDEKLNFLSEVEVMKRFDHKNIVKLLGVVLKSEPVFTIMELMLYGDLKTYLLGRRHLINKNYDYNNKNNEDTSEISSKKLTSMAKDVAKALAYLSQLKYVHRDVASRNCLVNDQRVVKLGDFGMTRRMYENDYYKFSRKAMLPVRWMAPESLELGVFTPSSDVWSYGVLLYEIITFGSFPFQGMSNNQVLGYVKSGNSLAVPKGVKQQLESLMRSCWSKEPTSRPTAPRIVEFLTNNPRVIAPSLDVPLASVPLENTDQMEMRMDRRFSFPWTNENDQSTSNSPFVIDVNCHSLLSSFKDHAVGSMNEISSSCETESTRPLLGEETDSVPSIRDDFNCRYTNEQKSRSSAFLNDKSDKKFKMRNNLHMEER